MNGEFNRVCDNRQKVFHRIERSSSLAAVSLQCFYLPLCLALSISLSRTLPIMSDIRTSVLKSPIDVVDYLFTRLQKIGVRSVHGVSGDFNFLAFDYIPQIGLKWKWVGNCNEHNAVKPLQLYTRSSNEQRISTTPTS
jgi:hypothetical protein